MPEAQSARMPKCWNVRVSELLFGGIIFCTTSVGGDGDETRA